MNHPPKPFEGCYWLKSGLLLAGELPSSMNRESAIEKLKSLQKVGIKTIVNLLSDEDFEFYRSRGIARSNDEMDELPLFPDYRPALLQIAEDEKEPMVCLRFPILDRKIPTPDLMKEILDTIDRELQQGRPVYFHCYAGIGRTGTVAGCWLRRHLGSEDGDTLTQLHNIRMDQGLMGYGRSPETEEQRDFVNRWPIRA